VTHTPATTASSPATPANAHRFEREFLPPLSLVLVRHGVTDMTSAQLLSGSGVDGPPLSAAGRVQAAKAADAIYRIGRGTWERVPKASRIVASPMARTQETAATIGRRLGVKVETDERVREIHFGDWEGLTAEQTIERDGDAILRWQDGDVAAPGGESIADVVARAREFLDSLAAAHAHLPTAADGAIVVVSHAVAIKALVGAAMGFPTDRVSRIWPIPASLTIVQLRVTPTGELAEAHTLCIGAPTD